MLLDSKSNDKAFLSGAQMQLEKKNSGCNFLINLGNQHLDQFFYLWGEIGSAFYSEPSSILILCCWQKKLIWRLLSPLGLSHGRPMSSLKMPARKQRNWSSCAQRLRGNGMGARNAVLRTWKMGGKMEWAWQFSDICQSTLKPNCQGCVGDKTLIPSSNSVSS